MCVGKYIKEGMSLSCSENSEVLSIVLRLDCCNSDLRLNVI